MVARSVEQLEKNVSLSFKYVKKDVNMLKNTLFQINDKIQQLNIDNEVLLENLQKINEKLSSINKSKKIIRKTKKTAKKKKKNIKKSKKKLLAFYDLKNRKKFKTNKYAFRTKSGRKFAVAKSPKGVSCWRIMGLAKKGISKKGKFSRKGAKSPKKIVKETIVY